MQLAPQQPLPVIDREGRDLGKNVQYSQSVTMRVQREGRGICLIDTANQGDISLGQSILDLIAAVKAKKIGGAMLDVFRQEPLPADSPLWDMPNVIMTPHISGSGQTQHYLPRVWEMFACNLANYRAGEDR